MCKNESLCLIYQDTLMKFTLLIGVQTAKELLLEVRTGGSESGETEREATNIN
jgi:hypothetical protein